MKKLNIKFLAIFFVSTLVVVVGVHFLHGYNVDKTGRLLLASAQEAEKEGKTQKAIRLYVTYDMQKIDEDHVGLRSAAKLALNAAKAPSATARDLMLAYEYMESLLRKEPDNNELRFDFVEMLMNDPRFGKDRLGTSLTELKKLRDEGIETPKLLFMYARVNEALGHDPEATEALEKLIGFSVDRFSGTALDSQNLEAYVLLAKILRERRVQPKLADTIIDRMVSANPDNGMAYVHRARYKQAYNNTGTKAQREQRFKEAEADIQTAYRKSPSSPEVIIEAAQEALRKEQYDHAVKMLTKGMESNPDESRFIQQLALATRMTGKPQEAIDFAKKGLKEQPENQMLLILLFELQLDSMDIAGASESVDMMKSKEFPSDIVSVYQARVDLRNGKPRQAAQALERARKQLDRNPMFRRPIDQDLGLAYGILGKPDLQLDAYNSWLNFEPTSPPALRGRAAALQRLGRIDDAVATLQTLGRELGIEVFMADKDLSEAYLQLLKVQLSRNPNDEQLKQRIASLEGRARTAGAEADPVREQLVSVGDSLKAKNVDEAAEKLQRLVDENPENIGLRLNLVRVYAARDGVPAGLKALQETKQKFGESPPIRLLEVLLLMEQGSPDSETKVDSLTQDLSAFEAAEQKQLLTQFGLIFWTKKNDTERVKEFWERAKQLEPDDPRMYQNLFRLARNTRDFNAARLIVADMKKQFGEDTSEYMLCQAQLLVDELQTNSDERQLATARELVEKVRLLRPSWHEPMMLLGDIERLSNRPEAAVANYLKALDSGPADAETIRRTAMLLMQLNRFQEGREVLNRLGSDDSEQTQRLKLYSDIQTGNAEQAMDSLAEVAPEDSINAGDWLWRGQILKQLKKDQEAETAFRRAIELGPESPATWNALVEHLVQTDQKAEAEAVTREAEIRLPEDDSPRLLANCYAMLGNQQLAEHYMQKALDESPDDLALRRSFATYLLQTNQGIKAQNMLASIARYRQVDGGNLVHVQWARRALASLLAMSGDYGQFREAVALVDSNATDQKLSIDDLRMLASLYGRRDEPVATRRALNFLEQIAAKQELNPQELLLKATLLDRSDRWLEARELLLDLVATRPSAQAYLVFARMLIDHETPQQAMTMVTRYEQYQKNTPEAVQMKAEIYIKLNRMENAVETLQGWITAGEDQPQQAARTRAAAGLLEKYEENQEARKMYERLVELQPEAELELLAFEARRGNAASAFEKLNAKLTDKTVLPLCQLGVAVLRARPNELGPEQQRMIAGWFKQARDLLPVASSNALLLEFEWASFNDLIHDHAETVASYRRLLQANLQPPQRAMVANNLAFKLALNGESPAEALQLVNSAIDTLGPAAALLDTRGMVYLAMNRPHEAVLDFEEATSNKPSGDLLFHLALGQQAAGDERAAYETIEQARLKGLDPIKLDPLSRKQYDLLIEAFRN